MNILLKSKGEANFTWVGAHAMFVMAEVIAMVMGLKSYKHDQSLLFAFVLPLLGIMPWLGGVMAVRRYTRIVAPVIQSDVQADFSFQIGGVVMSSYVLFIIATVVLDFARTPGK